MKTTIKVQETTTTTKEVEVSLPLFTKVVSDYFIDYYAFYDAVDNQKNMTFTVIVGSKKLFKLNMFAGINKAIEGEKITSKDFYNAFNTSIEPILGMSLHRHLYTTNDEQGEYYLTEQEQLLNSHE